MAVIPATRILVIDDEPLIRLDARRILEDAGYTVLKRPRVMKPCSC